MAIVTIIHTSFITEESIFEGRSIIRDLFIHDAPIKNALALIWLCLVVPFVVALLFALFTQVISPLIIKLWRSPMDFAPHRIKEWYFDWHFKQLMFRKERGRKKKVKFDDEGGWRNG